MQIHSSFFPYRSTGFFSGLVCDYLDENPVLKNFYKEPSTIEGLRSAITSRMHVNTNRKHLVQALSEQYEIESHHALVASNIQQLALSNTFTICTAHQPNIFTGHLYFIYKILHVIRIADELKNEFPENNFVPVYYMGSEDADLEELGSVTIEGKKYSWNTGQTGAVGRMLVDDDLLQLIQEMAGQLGVLPYGADIIALIRSCYTKGSNIETATFRLVNRLFGSYGLLVLIPDRAAFKNSFQPVIKKELLESFSNKLVQETIQEFPEQYKIQTTGREINLFYLHDAIRERILRTESGFKMAQTGIEFTELELLQLVETNPECFSPNVILRPVFQEWILPNIAFVGGGGELAYWLELKRIFDHLEVPYPVLILRNSFTFINEKTSKSILNCGITIDSLFLSLNELFDKQLKQQAGSNLDFDNELNGMHTIFTEMLEKVSRVDKSLEAHIRALEAVTGKRIKKAASKMLRSEKKKHQDDLKRLEQIKNVLFPSGNLQERVDNFLGYYAHFGKDFIPMILEHSTALRQNFCILRTQPL